MTQDRTRLRALAEALDALAATPRTMMNAAEWEEWSVAFDETRDAWREATATATVLALLDERDAERASDAESLAMYRRCRDRCESLKAERDALAATIARMEQSSLMDTQQIGALSALLQEALIWLPTINSYNARQLVDRINAALNGAKG
jgi:hypothetical protein